METSFQVGDVLSCFQHPGVYRRIVEVRPTGYTWEYADHSPGKTWESEHSNDPGLVWWKKYDGVMSSLTDS